MKNLFVYFMLFFAIFIAQAQTNGVVTGDLATKISNSKQTELIPINIELTNQYNSTDLARKSSLFKNKKERKTFVINELKDFSKKSQADLVAVLTDLQQQGLVKNIQPFWILNGISCSATKEVIDELSRRLDIACIDYDRMFQMIPKSKPRPADNSKEIVYGVLKVNADDVWALGYEGQDVIVAVLDTGVNYNHNDLSGNMWESDDYPYHGYDYVNEDNNPMDDNGHGTHCAGTVAGQGASGSQTGVAPQAKIMALKVLDNEGHGGSSDISSAITFALTNGADVLSMSFGMSGGGDNGTRSWYRNIMVNLMNAGIICSVAAGNDGYFYLLYQYPIPNNIGAPGNCPPPWLHPDQTQIGGLSAVVCVGATNQNDAIGDFSSRGPVTWQDVTGYNDYLYQPGIGLIRPDVCAPGVEIKSLRHNNNTGYTYMDGTSMAAPCVAGVMALLLSKNPELTPAEVCEALETTAHPLSTTKSNTSGSGRVDALAALQSIQAQLIRYVSHEIDDSEGNNDGKINPGETIHINLTMKSFHTENINNVQVSLSSDSSDVEITNSTAIFGTFSAGETKSINHAFTFTVSENAPLGETLPFHLVTTDNTNTWDSHFSELVYNYLLEILKVDVSDEQGDNNQMLNTGETVNLTIFLKNTGNSSAMDVSGILSTESQYITINSVSPQNFSTIETNQSQSAIFNITVADEAPYGSTEALFNLNVTDFYETENEFSFSKYVISCEEKVDVFPWTEGFEMGRLPGCWTEEFKAGSLSWIYENGGGIAINNIRHPEAAHSGSFNAMLYSKSSTSYTTKLVTPVFDMSNSTTATLTFWHAQDAWIGNKDELRVYYRNAPDATWTLMESFTATTANWTLRTIPLTNLSDNYQIAFEGKTKNGYGVVIDDVVVSTTPCEGEVANLNAATDNQSVTLTWGESENALFYKIYRNNEFIDSTTQTNYADVVATSGTYHYCVAAVYEDGCEIESCIDVAVTIITINEIDENSYKIYPNPTRQHVHIEGKNIENIVIYNITGQPVKNNKPNGKDKTTINVSNLKSGIYLVQIFNINGETIVKKLTIF